MQNEGLLLMLLKYFNLLFSFIDKFLLFSLLCLFASYLLFLLLYNFFLGSAPFQISLTSLIIRNSVHPSCVKELTTSL